MTPSRDTTSCALLFQSSNTSAVPLKSAAACWELGRKTFSNHRAIKQLLPEPRNACTEAKSTSPILCEIPRMLCHIFAALPATPAQLSESRSEAHTTLSKKNTSYSLGGRLKRLQASCCYVRCMRHSATFDGNELRPSKISQRSAASARGDVQERYKLLLGA